MHSSRVQGLREESMGHIVARPAPILVYLFKKQSAEKSIHKLMPQETGFATQMASAPQTPELPESAAGPRTYILVACVAATSLGLELIQTRILSYLYYNHVVYLTVTVALLGFGISGVFVGLFSSRSANPERTISLLAGAFAISSFACLAAVSRIPELLPEFANHSQTRRLVHRVDHAIFIFRRRAWVGCS